MANADPAAPKQNDKIENPPAPSSNPGGAAATPLVENQDDIDWREAGSRVLATRRARRNRIGVATLGLILALGAFVRLLVMIGVFRPTHFAPIIVDNYEAFRYPTNHLALEDGQAIARALGSQPVKSLAESAPIRLSFKNESRLSQGRKIIYVNMYARSVGEAIFLLPASSDPANPPNKDDSHSWIDLERALSEMDPRRNNKKLLILDIVKPLAAPQRGIVVNDVAWKAGKLLQKLEAAGKLPFPVLLAGASEYADWAAADATGHSMFGYYVSQALNGAADGWGRYGVRDGRITVLELAEYVIQRAAAWQHENNEHLYMPPRLFGARDMDDFRLTSASRKVPEPEPAQPEFAGWLLAPRKTPAKADEKPRLPEYPVFLAKEWELHDAWIKEARLGPIEDVTAVSDYTGFRSEPLAVHLYERYLLLAERKLDAGESVDSIQKILGPGLEFPRTIDEQTRRILKPAPQNVKSRAPAVDEAKEKEARKQQEQKADSEFTLLLNSDKDKPNVDTLVDSQKANLAVLVNVALKTRLADSVRIEKQGQTLFKLLAAIHKVQSHRQGDGERPFLNPILGTEVLLSSIDYFAEKKEDPEGNWPVQAARETLSLIQCHAEFEVQPLNLSGIKSGLEEILKEERAAQKELIAAKDLSAYQSVAMNLRRIVERWRSLEQKQKHYDEVRRLCQEAAHCLPGYVDYVLYAWDSKLEAPWRTAASSATQLSNRLAEGDAARWPEEDEVFAECERNLKLLHDKFRSDRDEFLKHFKRTAEGQLQLPETPLQPAQMNSQNYRKIQALLSCPMLESADRKLLWQIKLWLGRELAAKAAISDWEAKPEELPAPESSADPQEPAQARFRIDALSDLIRLGGASETLAQVKPGQELSQRARDLRQVWLKELPDLFRDRCAEKKWQEADRISRILCGIDRDDGTPGVIRKAMGSIKQSPSPTVSLYLNERETFNQWRRLSQ